MYVPLNVHYLNIRLNPYLKFYIQKDFRLLYKDMRGELVYVRINDLPRFIQQYDYMRFLLKNRSRLYVNTSYYLNIYCSDMSQSMIIVY
jgi:hypothetical protein